MKMMQGNMINGVSPIARRSAGRAAADAANPMRQGPAPRRGGEPWSSAPPRPPQAMPADRPSEAGGESTAHEMLQRRRAGASMADLAEGYGYTKAQVSRLLARQRYCEVQEIPLDFIPNERFPHVRGEEERMFLGPPPPNDRPVRKVVRPAGLPPYLASMYETPLLTREQEVHLFRKLNFLKYKASRLRERLDPDRPSVTAMEDIERFSDEASVVKSDIVRAIAPGRVDRQALRHRPGPSVRPHQRRQHVAHPRRRSSISAAASASAPMPPGPS